MTDWTAALYKIAVPVSQTGKALKWLIDNKGPQGSDWYRCGAQVFGFVALKDALVFKMAMSI